MTLKSVEKESYTDHITKASKKIFLSRQKKSTEKIAKIEKRSEREV
jgi:hypothetical protein